MIRSFIILLLLAVFFLSGMLYGLDRGGLTEPQPVIQDNQLESQLEERDFYIHENNTGEAGDEILEIREQKNLTQQTASFLEASVKGIYDVIVHILYQFAQLFF